jgi:aminoglycoside phosphotransferase family enzyme
VKELTDFTLLLERERKNRYNDLMEDFGFKVIESNVQGIHHAEKVWLNTYKKIEGK